MDKLVLKKPIKINGEEVTEIEYDFDNFTAKDKINASKRYKKDGNVISVEELDSDYHLYIFAEAAAKVNKNIDLSDILRINAKDAARAEGIVRDFFYLDSEETSETSQTNSSENQ